MADYEFYDDDPYGFVAGTTTNAAAGLAGGIDAAYALTSAPADAVPVVGEANISAEAVAGAASALTLGVSSAVYFVAGC